MEWQGVLRVLRLLGKIDNKSQENKIKREDELMIQLLGDESIKKILCSWLEKLNSERDVKSIEKAEEFKKNGNKHFQMKQYNESIQMYTKSALYAPADSPNLSIAFANRSASLFYLNRYNDCIKDIALAVSLNYPKQLCHKIYLRELHCYLKLGKKQLAKETVLKIQKMVHDPTYEITPAMKESIDKNISEITFSDSTIQSEEQYTCDLSKVKSQIIFEENKNFPNASASIDIKYNEEVGRHVVANKFINKGEILFVEKPISIVLIPNESISDRCHNCNCFIGDIPIPCKTCLYTYCGEKCLNEAWSLYHCWECPGSQMRLWGQVGITHLASKVLFNCSTMSDKIRFNQLQNLVSHFDKIPDADLRVNGIAAMMLTIYLSEYTNFFETTNLENCLISKFSDNAFNSNFNISTKIGKHLYVSSLLLRYIHQLTVNAAGIIHSNVIEDDVQINIVATGIYPSASMMNHSCNPNIIKIYMDQYLIVRAVEDIFPTEEIFNSYVATYRYKKTKARQKLLELYYFSCKCEACTVPELKYFVETCNAKKCLKCNGALCQMQHNVFCISCGDTSQHYEKTKVIQAKQLYKKAQNSISSGESLTALFQIEECLRIRKTVLYEYNQKILDCWALKRNVLFRRGLYDQNVKCWMS
ncbi:protein-lysine N-methyltransferase SMYD4 isoform X2 [Megachile rotundata]|uniref:protein-lysine N-methyltransferase SMYD4 isoform X2 n=1 Tax=Megachile rotundata TaxID=143995 RepID=UPI000614D37E|nr:PREDICTED: SET and MYND domain-containing protein 4-like isoform X2 [Megachile rotundata]